jgi:hypothetical protein
MFLVLTSCFLISRYASSEGSHDSIDPMASDDWSSDSSYSSYDSEEQSEIDDKIDDIIELVQQFLMDKLEQETNFFENALLKLEQDIHMLRLLLA